jgi:serine/threonine protein kinase
MMSCKIFNHELKKSCNDNKICYKNDCRAIKKMLSGSKNVFGDVFSLQGSRGSKRPDNIVVKVNKKKIKSVNFFNEIKIQQIAAKHNLAPQILEYYVDKSTQKYYIIMDDLLELGYKTFHDNFKVKKVPLKVLVLLKDSILKLNKIGISHKDLHGNNIFYNPKTHDIKFIDFGLSSYHKSRRMAVLNEKWDIVYSLSVYTGPWKHSSIGNKYIKFGKNYGLSLILLECYFNKDIKKIRNYLESVASLLKMSPEIPKKIEQILEIKNILLNKPSKKTHITLATKFKKEISFIIKINKENIKDINNIPVLMIYQN